MHDRNQRPRHYRVGRLGFAHQGSRDRSTAAWGREEIKSFVRDRLSAYAYPRKIEFVDDLPKTLTGKIRLIELRERENA